MKLWTVPPSLLFLFLCKCPGLPPPAINRWNLAKIEQKNWANSGVMKMFKVTRTGSGPSPSGKAPGTQRKSDTPAVKSQAGKMSNQKHSKGEGWMAKPVINHILMMLGNGSCCSSSMTPPSETESSGGTLLWCGFRIDTKNAPAFDSTTKTSPSYQYSLCPSPFSFPPDIKSDRKWGIYQFRRLSSCVCNPNTLKIRITIWYLTPIN